jgi:acyl-CoA synthetase (AMP-forming)/AMP-acid ligase II
MQVFSPASVFVMYGSTEAAPRLTYLDPALLPNKLGSIGAAIPNVEVFVAGANGSRLPQGEVGEIAARGSNIMMGYWKDPIGTTEALRDGIFFTGDLGREDEDGQFFVVGRKNDIIKVGGNRVSAEEIEEAILELPGVSETAVIAVPDDILGEAIKAFLVPMGQELSEEIVRGHLKTRLAGYKLPKHLEFRLALPKNVAGKIMKEELRREIASKKP